MFQAEGGWSFARPQYVPGADLTMPLMQRAEGLPAKPPRAFTYLPVNTSDTLIREDRFSPYELWYTGQHEAEWMDESGNTIAVATVRCEFPDFPTDEETGDYRHVKLDDFKAECARPKWELNAKSEDRLRQWFADFAPARIFAPERIELNSHALERLLRFPNNEGLLIYALLPRRTGKRASSRWIAVVAAPAQDNRRNVDREYFEKKFLGEIKVESEEKKGESDKNRLKVKKSEKDGEFPPHPVREFAAKSISCHKSWWRYETEGYVVLSDLYDSIGKSVMRDLSEYLPPFRKLLRATLPPMDTQTEDVFLVRIFARRESYLRYAGMQMQWTAAFWDPQRRELVMNHSGGAEEFMPTLLHEATHQYLSFAYAMITPSPWFNEGHACLFSRIEPAEGDKAKVGIDERFADLLAADPEATEQRLHLLLKLDRYEDFYAQDASVRQFNYAMAWGLCFYLQYGVKADGSPEPYSEILPRYTRHLARTRDAAKATEKAFENIDLDDFAIRFADFWSRSGMAKKALRLSF